MTKQIQKLTSVFLSMNRLVLFILIAFPLTIRFYSPPSDDYIILNRIIGSIGGICLLGWLFAIGHKANDKLISQGINADYFRKFNLVILSVVVSYLLIVFVSTDVNTTINAMSIHYVTPVYLPILFCLSFLITIAIAAKTLVSAELNKQAGVGDYFSTMLLMVFAAIGLWFIQPRVQKILMFSEDTI